MLKRLKTLAFQKTWVLIDVYLELPIAADFQIGSQLRFPHMGQFWVMGVLAGIGTEDPPERGIIRDKHTWHHSPPAQWMG